MTGWKPVITDRLQACPTEGGRLRSSGSFSMVSKSIEFRLPWEGANTFDNLIRWLIRPPGLTLRAAAQSSRAARLSLAKPRSTTGSDTPLGCKSAPAREGLTHIAAPQLGRAA